MTKCPMCDKTIRQPRTGRRRVYCSAACKQRAYDRRRLDAARQEGEQQEHERAGPFIA